MSDARQGQEPVERAPRLMHLDELPLEEVAAHGGDGVIGFPQQDPTTEIMAKAIFDHATQALRDYADTPSAYYTLRPEVRLVAVRVWETSSSWAEYVVS